MDSLLASYGSDEEDGDSPPGSPNPVVETSAALAPSWSRLSIFGSLPPPRNSAPESSLWNDEDERMKPSEKNLGGHGGKDMERTGLGTSFFTSLQPPKDSASEGTDWGEPLTRSAGALRDRPLTIVNDDRAEKKRGGSLSSAPVPPALGSAALPSDFFNDSTSVSLAGRPSHDDGTPERLTGEASSLFARLPLPASSKSLFEKLPPPSTSKLPAVPRKVVEFRPPVKWALLETTEDDDLERSRKRSKLSKEIDRATEPKAGGLVALLPPPKNNLGAGAALGGGGAHGGRRTIMETASDSYKEVKEVNSSSGNYPHKEESRTLEEAEVRVAHPERGVSSFGYGSEASVQLSGHCYAQPDSSYYDPQHQNSGEPYVEHQLGSSNGYLGQNNHDRQSRQYSEGSAFVSASQPTQGYGSTPNVVAEVMKKERRRGRDELPPEMIEVKQADLTGGSKLRDDQLRATGIAFGPSYKPASSTKDKPSKLHRRKHQLGALYFDMKQNEMNLLERRAKGSLTKAETQAKYGW